MKIENIGIVIRLTAELNKILENKKILPVILEALEKSSNTESITISHIAKVVPTSGDSEIIKKGNTTNTIFLTGNTRHILSEFLKQIETKYDEEKERLEKKLELL